jgi:hypothetical protein
MWIEAILSKDDFVALAAELLPLTINLGDPHASGHYIELKGPADVSLVAGKGLRIACKAEVRWPVLGVEIPIHVESLALLIEPAICSEHGEDEALFKVEIENADVAWVPALVDRGIVKAINEALHAKRAELRWQFVKTLSHVFDLPELLEPLHGLALDVAWGKIRTTDEAVVFAVSFHTRTIRQGEPRPERAPTRHRKRAPRSLARHEPLPPVAVAAGTALAVVTGYMACVGLYHLFARPLFPRLRGAF